MVFTFFFLNSTQFEPVLFLSLNCSNTIYHATAYLLVPTATITEKSRETSFFYCGSQNTERTISPMRGRHRLVSLTATTFIVDRI